MPAFKVGRKGPLDLERDRHMTVAVDKVVPKAAVADDPSAL